LARDFRSDTGYNKNFQKELLVKKNLQLDELGYSNNHSAYVHAEIGEIARGIWQVTRGAIFFTL
jgi:hypothetical protein